MDFERVEETLDEIVWNMMKTLNDKDIDFHDAQIIIERIAHLALSGEFERFYSDFEYEKDDPGFKEWVKDAINTDSW